MESLIFYHFDLLKRAISHGWPKQGYVMHNTLKEDISEDNHIIFQICWSGHWS